ncbi:hypothetical protein CONLIGDRAFT_4230 [Coniochaeta ligniaria NRRL 30616]|uniref:Fungal N-terminal domain-containing protein n=1 Tax=Coniochaeta ligniaria NRRL 30616 TaxID=1408157 RepID=A0A1J7JYB4_9PEZI|nr:hypothetical protein CONLIGDRAFT_4230 [Coniochaeta ligniaria NRRL 30616]
MRAREPCLLTEAEGFCLCLDLFIESYLSENYLSDKPTVDDSYTRKLMGDPLSTVASSIALVQAAGKLAKTCQALHSMWQDVKDVPEKIGRLLKSIEIMTLVFAGIERNACNFRMLFEDDDQLLSDIVKLTLQAVIDLQILVKDLGRDIHAERRTTKLAARVRVVLKEPQLSKHELRLQKCSWSSRRRPAILGNGSTILQY